MSNQRRVMVNIPEQLLEQVDGIAYRERTNRSEIIREAMRRYVTELMMGDIREAMQQGYVEMARINLRIANESFAIEQEAGGTVERLVSGV